MPRFYYVAPHMYTLATVTIVDHVMQARATKMLPICLGIYKGSFPSWWLHCNMESLETFGSNIPLGKSTTEEGSLSMLREESKAEALTRT